MPGPVDRSQLILALEERLAGFPAVRLAVLFGSYAQDRAGTESDVDLAVFAPEQDLLALGAALSVSLGREVDVISLDDPPIPLLEEIVAHGVVVHEASPGSGALWRSHALASLDTDRPWLRRMHQSWLRKVAERGL